MEKGKINEEAQEEYDNVIKAFYGFYDYGDDYRNEVEQEIIDLMDDDLHRDLFAAFVSGYKYARRVFTGEDIVDEGLEA